MESLGDYLKQARKKKGLSLEKVASQTRIQEHHLQALEAEDFANLPAKVFAKGFVRSYAKALGLDEEEALQHFLQTSGNFYDQLQPDQSQPHVQVKLDAAPRQRNNWSLIIGALVLIAVGAIWYGLPKQQDTPIALSEPETPVPIEPIQPLVQKPNPTENITPITPVDSEPREVSPPLPEIVLPKSQPITPIFGEPSPPSPPPADEATADGSHTLEIEATQLTWVVVQSDQQAPKEALLQPGQRITWKANQQFQLTLGNAAGVVIRMNGQPQGPFGKPGQVVRDIRLRP
ncbi:MAG: RodZ domain-containing protein [Nitrospirales bacterium]